MRVGMRTLPAVVLLAAAFCWWTEAAAPKRLRRGQKLFEDNCVACYAMDGSGTGRGADLRRELQYGSNSKELIQVIQHGIPGRMPATDLSGRDAHRLADYVLYLNGGKAKGKRKTAKG